MRFHRVIGIDYAGAGRDAQPLAGLAAWVADRKGTRPLEAGRKWSRDALTGRLAQEMEAGPVLVAIDHAFAYGVDVLDRLRVRRWDDLARRLEALGSLAALRDAVGHTPGWRLADRAAPGTQDPLGIRTYRPVSHSTFHGIRHLARLRARVPFHLWPFDGWRPPAGASVVAEGFPNMLRRRTPATAEGRDDQDAERLARHFWTRDQAGVLNGLFEPALTRAEQAQARREGWILGVA